jgi:hypothetical protein
MWKPTDALTNPDPREDRLPAWVRQQFATLRRRTEDAEQERADARLATDPAESDTVLDAYADIPIGLGKEAIVRFRLGDEERMEWIDAKVSHDAHGGTYLRLMSGENLQIEPCSSNRVHLRAV